MRSRLCLEELRMAHKILDAGEIKAALAKLPDWSVNGNNIEAKFAFQGFRDAISFIVQIAIEAEVMNHHPEFHNSWNIVSFSFCTHDVGNKITDADINIATKISEAARRFISMK
jgi:4a-hydroxytetrahydrobiopterin dehydratase